MNDKLFSRMFFWAAVWNFAAGAPALLFYERQFKLVFAFFTDALLRGHATMVGWVVSIVDLLWAVGFFWFLCRTSGEVRVNNFVGYARFRRVNSPYVD